MIRPLILLAVCSLLSFAVCGNAFAESGPPVRFVESESLSLVYFVHTLANHRPNGVLFSKFRASHPLSPEENRLLDEFKSQFGDDNGKYVQYIELEHQALHADSVEAFRRKLRDGSPNSLLALSAIDHFKPLYEQHVWNDSKALAKQKVSELQKKYGASLSKAVFEVEHFLKCDLALREPLTVGIVVVPSEAMDAAGRDGHAAKWDGENKESYCIIEEREDATADDVIGTVMHELVHELWDRRSIKVVNELNTWFALHYGQEVMEVLPESIPTAIGSGWYATKVTGKPARFWYSIPRIKDLAKAIEPECARYLNENQTIDEHFVSDTTAVFFKLFY